MMQNEKPVYLLAGGRPKTGQTPSRLIRTVFEETGVKSPTVAYVGVANGDDPGFFHRMAEFITEAGARSVNHVLLCPKKADIKKAQHILQTADVIYVSGGDVEAGMQVLAEKDMVAFLASLYKQGKPFFGLSAGSIMLAREWVRWRNPDDDSTAELFPCLGIASVICDTHGEEDGWEELQALLNLEQDNVRGFGIVSGTGLKVYPDGRVEAMGGAVHRYMHCGGKVIRDSDLLPVRPA
jgi:cyanophycinase-like exopeptidase